MGTELFGLLSVTKLSMNRTKEFQNSGVRHPRMGHSGHSCGSPRPEQDRTFVADANMTRFLSQTLHIGSESKVGHKLGQNQKHVDCLLRCLSSLFCCAALSPCDSVNRHQVGVSEQLGASLLTLFNLQLSLQPPSIVSSRSLCRF